MKRKSEQTSEHVPERILTDALLEQLKRDGAVVVPNVLPQELCQQLHQAMLQFHNRWEPAIEMANSDSWTADRRPPGPHGLNQFCGQQQFCWDTRQHPRVAQVFAELYDVRPQDLLTSMDGFRFLKSGRVYARGNWGHTDQGAHLYNDAYVCVQASVAIAPSTHDLDGDFVYWRHGHRAHKGYFDKHPDAVKSHENWYKYPQEFLDQIHHDGREYLQKTDPQHSSTEPLPMTCMRVRRNAGDMVLWYSTTPHQSDPPAAQAPHDAACVFVCMAPRKFATTTELQKRIKAFEERRTTSHWPIRGFHMFPKRPRLWSKVEIAAFDQRNPRVNPPDPQLTALGRRLVGYAQSQINSNGEDQKRAKSKV
jgi:hypothetical protein